MREDCFSRAAKGTVAGVAFGSVAGALGAAWEAPATSDKKGFSVARVKSAELPRSFQIMGNYAARMAALGLTYSVGDCVAETIRDTEDPINSALGGALAGALIGLQRKRLDYAAGTALACGTCCLVISMNGGKISHERKPRVLRVSREEAAAFLTNEMEKKSE